MSAEPFVEAAKHTFPKGEYPHATYAMAAALSRRYAEASFPIGYLKIVLLGERRLPLSQEKMAAFRT